jgi:hypothetical protein
MNRTATSFLAGLVVFGGAVGVLVAHRPALEGFVVPPFWWPLFAALVFDLATRPAVAAGRMPEMPMNMRALGVVAGALTYQAVRWLLPTA